ncbi:1-phosphatidylinositol 4,5-bisphosphate phosphodiesterase eta-1 [Triplophysa tibetana]|uniref:1-phosphatidylinositol 4,5-bisphosphate phosphodiesterase eta-1 n=1 Tax=Triplophysa tibetana TaxID=1572043 RepID=A0A5A9NX56_9TELE|nr:1-phosphatidylinositol 4,5-bisphosphate phosphodiesterase eta-1 [Triplophysa tibetana]
MPEVALVRFLVWDHDPIGRDFVGQRTVAFSSLMPGYRHVYLEGMTEASIFVYITVHDIYGKWSPLVLNPSYTIMHLLGANKGRQLRGFRGLFNKSSKSSVDTNIGVPPRKRSITDHLLRRTASAPAKGRKKSKMPLAEAPHDRKLSTGDSQPADIERRTDQRKTLQHRPVSMPMEKLLHSKLNLTSPDQVGTDDGPDTITGRKLTRKTPADCVRHRKPKSISMDLLIETSAFKGPDGRSLSANLIQDCNTEPKETKETPYLVIESSRESVVDPHQEHSREGVIPTEDIQFCSSKKPADHGLDPSDYCNGDFSMQTKESQRESSHLQSPRKKVLSPKAATYSSSSSSSSSSRTFTKSDPQMDQTDQGQVSLQDSALSRLIDAVSLGNENDTCGSISALIGQFDLTVEQSPLNVLSNSQPLKFSVPPNDLPDFSNELSSTPLKAIQESSGITSALPDRPSSPATTEPEVFTILDEEVLSPVSSHNLYQKNFQKDLIGSPVANKVSSPIRWPLERFARDNVNLVSNRKTRYGSQCHSTGSLMHYEFGGYRETSMNSTISDRFLMCQDSASSSLMEVEINVDGDSLDDTLISPNQDHHWCNDLRNGSNQPSPYHIQRPEQSHPHKPSNHPSPGHSHSMEKVIHRHDQSPSSHHSPTSRTVDHNKSHPRRFPLGTHRIVTTEERHQETRYQSGYKVEHLPKSSLSSECLARTQGRQTSLERDLYTPVSDIDVIYNSVALQDNRAPINSYSPQKCPPPISPVSSNKSKSLGDLTSEDISCNFQSKYKFISRSFVTPAMRDQRRMCGLAGRPKASDPLTEQLRKLVTLEHEDYPHAPSSSQPTTKLPTVLQSSADDPEDPPPFLSRRLSSRSQSRVRHIANRAREKQQDALKHRHLEGSTDVVLRNKLSSQNPPPNRHSTGSYIAGYLDQLGPEDRGLPEGACTTLRYGYGDGYYADDSLLPPDSFSQAEPEVYFLLRL